MTIDYALVFNENGLVTAHKLDCPDVVVARADGHPILNMFDCARPLNKDHNKHECLNQQETPHE